MDKSLPDDRRRYFRISDHLGVAYRVASDEHIGGGQVVNHEPVSIFQLLEEQEKNISELLGQLQSRDPLLADIAQALNQKINCVLNQLEMESRMIEQIAHKVCEVNISACGLGFQVDEEIGTGIYVHLDLVLLPENRRILTDAVVVNVETLDGGYYLRLNFVNIHPQDQEMLIQHIVKRQGDLLRNAREQAEKLQQESQPEGDPGPKSAGV